MSYLPDQTEHIARIDASVMNQDMPLPLDLMKKYRESDKEWAWAAFGADLGCGNGSKTAEMFEALDMGGFAFEINPELLKQAQKNVLMTFKGDVTDSRFLDQMTIDNNMAEWYGIVNMGGLLVNTPGKRHSVWKTADRLLTPGGHVFISEVTMCDEPNSCMEERLGKANYEIFQSVWRSRYENNAAIGLPYGTIVVAKPGSDRSLEWGSSADLLRILSTADKDDGMFERVVEHQNIETISKELTSDLGYEVVEVREGMVKSRVKGSFYPTSVIVARKPKVFRYRTGRVGQDRAEIMRGNL